MIPAGEMRFRATVKEELLTELTAQQGEHGIVPIPAHIDRIERTASELKLHFLQGEPVLAKRVIVAIGRTGNFRKLNVPGEGLDKVSNRLIDSKGYDGRRVLVVGGGDSALEAAISLAESGASVDLSYRKKEFSRPKAGNLDKLETLAKEGKLSLHLGTTVQDIDESQVTLCGENGCDHVIPNDNVFVLIGREAPLDFFRRSGIHISGEHTPKFWLTLAGTLLFSIWLYHWKKGGALPFGGNFPAWLNPQPGALFSVLHGWWDTAGTFGNTIKVALSEPSFYYSLAYCVCVLVFGIRRIQRRKTPYVKLQTTVLTLVQWIPLFILPYFV
ncbi:MAG: NAD(P)-binding domain-containing protein, partial [Akkermansiaceae bacterium]|nr:NAD(P)-binding domain-containing protein [Akkermansiaceae bacterium]